MDFSRPLSTITPTLDGDVLAALARSKGAFTTGQLHRMLGKASEEGIRKVLRRLVKQGVVTSAKVGNAHSYQLNRDHLAARYITGLAVLQGELFLRLEELLASWQVRPTYAAVFGSTAIGTMTADSDVDLLLVSPDSTDDDQWRAQVEDLIHKAELWTGNDVHPLEISEADIVHGLHGGVLTNVVAEGITLLGSAAWLTTHVRKAR